MEDIIEGLTGMAEEAIKIGSSIKVSVLGLICQRDENANEKINMCNQMVRSEIRE